MKNRRLLWIPYCAVVYAVVLVLQLLLIPHDDYGFAAMASYFTLPILTMVFGPFLFVAQDAWLGSGDWWWALKIAPLYIAHLAFIWGLLSLESIGGWKPCRIYKIIEICLVACISAAGIWFSLPEAGHYEFVVDKAKLPGGPIRIAVVSDLHSCSYGPEQRGLTELIDAQHPDLVVMTGDILDDRFPDSAAHALIEQLIKRYPCAYVTGNHEFWSDRVCAMKMWMVKHKVVLLQLDGRTLYIKGNPVDVVGVDDPTELEIDYWSSLLDMAYAESDPSHLRIFLSHRTECPGIYAKYDYDLVVTGHSHGGHWRNPFTGRGVYAPDQGFFPKYSAGVYDLTNGKPMLSCRGLARENTPVPRYFNHPEVAIVDIVPRTEEK